MRLRRYLSILIVCLLASVSTVARAQAATGVDGVKLGDTFLLHVGLGLELGYDTNLFYEATNPHRAFELRLTPRFDLTNVPRIGGRQFQLDFHGGLNYLEYLSSNPAVERLRQFNVDTGVLASFFALNPYNFQIFDNYVRSAQAPYSLTDHNFDRDTNEIGVRINLSPGGGRLSFYIGYVFGIDFFEPQQLQAFNLLSHRFDFRASWKVLPKTAIYIAASEALYLYQNQGNGVDSYDHPNSYPFRIVAGIQGLITTKLTLNAFIGYGNGFYQKVTEPTATGMTTIVNANPNTPIGGVAVTWKPTILSTGTLGYDHDFVNSLLGSYYDADTVYASWTQLVWRFTGFLRVSYANQRYNGITPLTGDLQSTRTDNYVTLSSRVDYPFMRWLWGSVGYDLQLNRSNAVLDLNPAAAVVPVTYTKSVVYLRLTAWY